MEKQPRAIFMFGTNGSGKSTIREDLDLSGINIIDPDLIAKENNQTAMQAGRTAINQFNNYIENRQGFLMESTLSGSSVIRRVQTAKEAGFQVDVYFIGLENAALNKLRISERVAKGGHHIEDETVDRRFVESVENLPKVFDFVDTLRIYDNSVPHRKFLECWIIENRQITYELPDGQRPEWTNRIADSIRNHFTLSENLDFDVDVMFKDMEQRYLDKFRQQADIAFSRMGHDDLKMLHQKAAEFMRIRPYQEFGAYERDSTGFEIEKWRVVESKPEIIRQENYQYFTAQPVVYSEYDRGYIALDKTVLLEKLPDTPDMKAEGYSLTGVYGHKDDGSAHIIKWDWKFKEWGIAPAEQKMATYTAGNFANWHEADFKILADKIRICKSENFKHSTFENKISALSSLLKELDYIGVYPSREVFPVYQEYVAGLAKDAGIGIRWENIDAQTMTVARQKYLAEMAIERQSERLASVTPNWSSENIYISQSKHGEYSALQRIEAGKASLEKAYPRISLEKAVMSVSNRLENKQVQTVKNKMKM